MSFITCFFITARAKGILKLVCRWCGRGGESFTVFTVVFCAFLVFFNQFGNKANCQKMGCGTYRKRMRKRVEFMLQNCGVSCFCDSFCHLQQLTDLFCTEVFGQRDFCSVSTSWRDKKGGIGVCWERVGRWGGMTMDSGCCSVRNTNTGTNTVSYQKQGKLGRVEGGVPKVDITITKHGIWLWGLGVVFPFGVFLPFFFRGTVLGVWVFSLPSFLS